MNKTYTVEKILGCMNLGIDFDSFDSAEEAIEFIRDRYPELDLHEWEEEWIREVYES